MSFAGILYAFAVQMLFTVGVIFVFGYVISLCNRLFYANFGRYGRAVCYATGFLGTPVHELSHAAMCLLFGHRIVEMRLFEVSSDDGTLGYVHHTYNRRNIYQRIGNFFIGVAPIIVISALLYGLAYLLLPKFAAGVAALDTDVTDAAGVFRAIGGTLKSFFTAASSWRWWVFVAVGMLFALHMNLSGADIKSALGGTVAIFALFFVADLIVGLISMSALSTFTATVVGLGVYMLCVFIVALVISLVALFVSFIFRLIRR